MMIRRQYIYQHLLYRIAIKTKSKKKRKHKHQQYHTMYNPNTQTLTNTKLNVSHSPHYNHTSANIWCMSPPYVTHIHDQHAHRNIEVNDCTNIYSLHLCKLLWIGGKCILPMVMLLDNVVGFEKSCNLEDGWWWYCKNYHGRRRKTNHPSLLLHHQVSTTLLFPI